MNEEWTEGIMKHVVYVWGSLVWTGEEDEGTRSKQVLLLGLSFLKSC